MIREVVGHPGKERKENFSIAHSPRLAAVLSW